MINIDKLIEEYQNDDGPSRQLAHEAAKALIQQRTKIKDLEAYNKEMYENLTSRMESK